MSKYIGYAEIFPNLGINHVMLAEIESVDLEDREIYPTYKKVFLAFAPDNQGLIVNKSVNSLDWMVYRENVYDTYEEAKNSLLKDLGFKTKNPKSAVLASILAGKWEENVFKYFK